ncbi:MAG TPA: GAF domain-containing protein, partial [Leptospiraceae bacterium]|nr:GAF domain-containing protein [Leptospiraceae bacterium]
MLCRVILLVFIFLFLVFSNCNDTKKKESPKVVKGVLDLQEWDFSKDGFLSLDGEWEFYWKELLSPETNPAVDANKNLPKEIQYIPVPHVWNDFRVNGESIGKSGFGSYRLKIILPKQKDESSESQPSNISLALSNIASAHRIYVNGVLVGEKGKVGTSEEDSISFMQNYTIDLSRKLNQNKTNSDLNSVPFPNELNIIIHVSNFNFTRGGIWLPLKIGTIDSIQKLENRAFVLDLIVFSSLLIMGLYHLGLYFNRKKDKSPLYFGIFCILISLRTVSINQLMILDALPFVPYLIILKIEYFSFYFGTFAFAKFSQILFPEEFSKKWLRFITIILIPCSLAVILFPVSVYLNLLTLVQLITLIAIVYFVKVLILSSLKNKPGAKLSLFSFLIFALSVMNDILRSMGILYTPLLASYGFLSFVVFQAIILSHRFAFGFEMAEKLGLELSQKSDRLEETAIELKELTQNLEAKVLERTKRLEETQKEIQDLNEFTQKVNSLSNLDSIFTEISRYVYENYGILAVWLTLPDENKKFLYTYKIYSYEKLPDNKYNYLKTKNVLMLDKDGGMVYKTFLRKKPLYLNKFPKFEFDIDRELVDKLSLQSILLVPLVRKNESVGVLTFSNLNKEMKLSKNEIRKISNLCSQIAGAIDTNHLLEKVEKAKRQTLELNQLIKVLNEKSNLIEIMEMLSFYINGKYKFPYYILSILDSQTNMLKYAHAFLPTGLGEKEIEFIKSFNLPIDFNNKESIHSQALAEQKPLFLPDSSSGIKSNSGKYILSFLKQKSSVTLPIILQKKPIAILDLFSQESVSLIQEDLVELSIFAEQLAGIINGSLLFKEVLTEKEKVESARLEIEKLNEITRKINAESDLVNILEFIFSHLQEEYSIDGTIVLLKDEQEENLRSFHTSAPIVNPEMIDYSRKLVIPLTDKEGGILYKAFSKNRTLYLAKVSPNRADTELIKAMIETLKFTSFLAVPLQIKNESFGLVLMTSYTRSEKLKKEEIEKIENFCEHVSGAIYNSLLLKQTEKAQRETEKQKRETEELNKLIKSLNEDLNIQVIMKKVYEYLKENHKIHYYGLGVIDDKEEKIITIDTLSPEFLTDEERLRVSQFSTKINEKIGGHAFAYRSGKPFYIPKIRKGAMTEEEQYNQRVTKLESLLIIPLILQGNFIGFLDLYNVGRMELDKDDLNKLSILGEQLAGIIYSSSLLKKIQEEKRNADNTRQEIEKLNEFTRLINSTSDLSLIMNEVYSYLNQNFEITNVWTLLVDKNSNEFYTNENLSIYRGLESIDNNYFLSFRESINEKLGTMYQIFNTKNPIYISDFTKTIKGTKNEYFNEINGEIISGSKIDLKIILKGKLKTTLQLPLIVQDEVIGIISLSSPNTILKLTNIDLEKLIRFSNQIAGVIQNAQLLKETEKAKLEADLEKENAIVAQKETEKARKEIEKLNEFTKRINEKYDLDEMLDLVGEYIVTNFPISHYLLWKKDFDGKSLSPYKGTYSKDIPEENIKKFKELKIPLEYDEGVHASVCKNKKYLFMRGIKRHKSLSNIENTINELLDFDSLLVIPLINQNQVIGTMDFSNYSGKMSISKDEIKRIGIFCEQVSGVIHGAGLLKQAEEAKKNALVAQLETEKQKQETEELNKLIKSLNEELDLKVIMQKVLQYVNLHFHIQYYALYKSNKQNTHVEMEEANFPVHMTEENRINVLNLKIPIKNVKGVHAFPFKAKRPFFIPRLRESGGTEEENFIKRVYNISSIIVIPLILNNDIIGTIDFSSEQKLQLSKDDITKLSILGEQLAGIIHGSNLLKQVQEEKEKSESIRLEIEKLNELTKKINSTSDLDSILEIVFNYFEKEFGLLGFILGINNSTNQIHCLKTSSLEFSPEEVKFASNIQETLGPELG